MMTEGSTGFVLSWGLSFNGDPEFDSSTIRVPLSCRWCETALVSTERTFVTYAGNEHLTHDQVCPLCGWRYDVSWTGDGYGRAGKLATMYSSLLVSLLHETKLDDPTIALDELGTHLKRHYTDIHRIPWKTFEKLMVDVFSRNGARVIYTATDPSAGADAVLYSLDGKDGVGILEIKHYSPHRPVSFQILRGVIGAAPLWDAREVTIVTTSRFTKAVLRAVPRYQQHGYTVNLVDGAEILRLLGVYNKTLPPLDVLDVNVRKEIIRTNMTQLKN